jgi:uncharacterized membrane protein
MPHAFGDPEIGLLKELRFCVSEFRFRISGLNESAAFSRDQAL